MQRDEWLRIQRQAEDTEPASIYHETALNTNILLCEMLEQLLKLNQRLEHNLTKAG